jgi:hypothetical protein
VLTARLAWEEGEWARPTINSTPFLFIQKFSKDLYSFDQKRSFPCSKNFKKIRFESIEIRNNFPYWNNSKFGIEFE